jgi:oligopeptide transport system substrate-binding protein
VKKGWQLALLSLFLAALLVSPSISCQFFNRGSDLNLWDFGPMTLDPAISADMSSHMYVMQIFSGLVRVDEDLKIVRDIAESWQLSSDNKTYTFHLRQGVKFHNGREVKAADFKYSWERACDPATGSGTAATYLGDIVGAKDMLAGEAVHISGVEVVGDYTLRVTIDAAKAYFLNKLAYPTAFVVDRDNVGSGESWWRRPNGTGPFKLKEWTAGQQLILERSRIYYGEQAKVEQVVFDLRLYPPIAMYELGYIDVAPVSAAYIDRVRDETGPFYQELAISPELSLRSTMSTSAVPFVWQ